MQAHVFVLIALSAAPAGPSDPWVGQMVMLKSAKPDAGDPFYTYRVDRCEGARLHLVCDISEVWALSDDVVRCDRALDYFTEQIRLAPREASSYAKRGVIRTHYGKYDRALDDYNQAIEIDPRRWEYYRCRGGALFLNRDFDEAIADFDNVILAASDPIQACIAYNNRGTAWSEKRDFDRAIADFDMAIQIRPQWAYSYHNRGLARSKQDQFGPAIADFSYAIRLDPKHVESYYRRALVRASIEDREGAIGDLDEAIRLDPKHAGAYHCRALVRMAESQYERAIADLNEAIRLRPRSVDDLRLLGWLLANCPESKFRDGKKALELAIGACWLTSWSNADALDTLASAQACVGDLEAAVKSQRRALALTSEPNARQLYSDQLKLYEQRRADADSGSTRK